MEARDNLPELSVSELSLALKRLVEDGFAYVRVKGEISGFKRHSSGHLYFALKDADAVLDAVCWRGQAMRLGINPEDGMEVSCTGKLTTYPGRSKYQMVVDSLNLAGQGALLKLLEERKRKLAALGLFDKVRKKKLPFLPQVIGVVTSPTGAVIKDILHRLADRFPCRVLLWPVAVQGDGAASQVAAAIEGFNRLDGKGATPRPDIIIVARGGGSIEDLWAFNEEIVVLAAANSKIPLISAVGHETDTTLIDYAADLRAPTPTAAAELATPVRAELIAQIKDDETRLLAASQRLFNEAGLKIQGLSRGIANPARLVEDKTQRLDLISETLLKAWPNRLKEWGNKLAELKPQEALKGEVNKAALEFTRKAAFLRPEILNHILNQKETRLQALGGMLKAYSYQGVLERGFALVQDKNGVITSASRIKSGQDIEISFHDGKIAAKTKPKQESLF